MQNSENGFKSDDVDIVENEVMSSGVENVAVEFVGRVGFENATRDYDGG